MLNKRATSIPVLARILMRDHWYKVICVVLGSILKFLQTLLSYVESCIARVFQLVTFQDRFR